MGTNSHPKSLRNFFQTSAGLTQKEHDYLYQQKKVYNVDMMYTTLNKCMLSDINSIANTTNQQAIAVSFHIDSFKLTNGLQDLEDNEASEDDK